MDTDVHIYSFSYFISFIVWLFFSSTIDGE